MKNTTTAAVFAAMVCGIFLTACGLTGPYPGVPELLPESTSTSRSSGSQKVAPTQVVYRIDEDRFFELVHRTAQPCANGRVYFIDKAKGIRASVVNWDSGIMGEKDFIIDAANDQYLIGPVTRGNINCSSGGGGCAGASMPYSTDAGRTWKRTWAQRPYVATGVSGAFAFSGGGSDLAKSLDLSKADLEETKWTYLPNFNFFPRKSPLDSKFQCVTNGKE